MVIKRIFLFYILIFLSCLRIPDVKLPGAKAIQYQEISSAERAERSKWYDDSLDKIAEDNWYTCWEEQIEFSKINGFNDILLSRLINEFDSTYDTNTLRAVDSIKQINVNYVESLIKKERKKGLKEKERREFEANLNLFNVIDSIYKKGKRIKRTKEISSDKPLLIIDSCSFSHLDSNNYCTFIDYINSRNYVSILSKKSYNKMNDDTKRFMWFGTSYGRNESKNDSIFGDTLPHIYISEMMIGSGWIVKYDLKMNSDSTFDIIRERAGGVFHY